MRIFYNPNTLEIKGMSDGEESMQFPSIVIDGYYHATDEMKIVAEGGEIKLTFQKLTLD